MSVGRHTLAWAAIVAAFVVFVLVFRDILLPFVTGIVLAYFLDPLTARLRRTGVPRALAAILVLVAFMVAVVAVFLLFVPLVASQIGDLIQRLPDYTKMMQEHVAGLLSLLETRLAPEDFEKIREGVRDSIGSALGATGELLAGVLKGGMAVFNFLALAVVTPVVAFYLMRDWDRIVARADDLLPRRHVDVIRHQVREVDRTLAGFLRGQVLVCTILGLFYGIGLTLAELPSGLVIGLLAGIVSFIPYVGTIIGGVLSIGLALLQFDEMWRVAIVAAIFLTGQVLEGNVLYPVLVGDRVRLHPVWVIFALFAGASVLGLLGMLLAVPVAAVIGVLVRFLAERYRESRLYAGDADGDTEP